MIRPKAILFDYGDTIVKSHFFRPIEGNRALLECAHNPKGLTAEAIQAYADVLMKDFSGCDQLQINSQAFTRLLYGVHGITFEQSAQSLEMIFLDAAEKITLMDGLIDYLNYVQSKGIPMAIVSNTAFAEASHRQQLSRFGIEDYFDFFIATVDYCVRKPDKRIFDVALQKLDLGASDVWYIGNKFEYDVIGAYNAGIYPVWLNEKGEKPLCHIDHLMIDAYDTLLPLTKGIIDQK